MNTQLTIGQLARQAGVGVETVRYYQKRGLMPAAPQHRGTFGIYGDDEIQRLRFIRRAQTLGFSLNEIAGLLELNSLSDHEQARRLAIGKIADIDARMRELTTMKTALEALVQRCRHGDHAAPCPILAAFGVADDPPPAER